MTDKLIMIKRLIRTVLFLALVLLPLKAYALGVGDKAPDFNAITVDGKEISYARDIEGKKPAYLIFWTTWCPHCKRELPLVEELYKKFGGKIEFMGINLGFRQSINEFLKKYRITFPIVFDEGEKIAGKFGAEIQTNVLIDKNGNITYYDRGFQENIRKHMKKVIEQER